MIIFFAALTYLEVAKSGHTMISMSRVEDSRQCGRDSGGTWQTLRAVRREADLVVGRGGFFLVVHVF